MYMQVYDTRLQLEEAERKEQKMATDYEILMVENSHLTEEIDKFGEIVQRAERALEAGATRGARGALGRGQQGGEQAARQADTERRDGGGAAQLGDGDAGCV